MIGKGVFYGPGGNVVPSWYFSWKKKPGTPGWTFSVKDDFAAKLIPPGFYWHDGYLVGRNGLWYNPGIGNVYFLGDLKNAVPKYLIRWDTVKGGFSLVPAGRKYLYPTGFKWRSEGLYEIQMGFFSDGGCNSSDTE